VFFALEKDYIETRWPLSLSATGTRIQWRREFIQFSARRCSQRKSTGPFRGSPVPMRSSYWRGASEAL